MKSIYQIAKEMDKSHQVVYRKFKSQFMHQYMHHVHKNEKGTVLIDSDGEAIFKSMFNADYAQSAAPEYAPVHSQIVEILQEQLKIKDGQLIKKDEQIQDILKKLENMQVLLKHEQEKSTLYLESSKKKSFWQRLFGGDDNSKTE